MVHVANLLTFVWLAHWALLAFRHLAGGRPHSILFVILVHFIFCGVPPLLDVVFGTPDYAMFPFPGFELASADPATCLIYCAYVSAIPPLWWIFGRGSLPPASLATAASETQSKSYPSWLYVLLNVLLVSPLGFLAFAPDWEMYATYAHVLRDVSEEAREHHAYIALASRLSILSVAALLFLRPRLTLGFGMVLVPWWLLDVWLFGKRSEIALSLVLVMYVLWARGVLRGSRLLVGVTVCVTALTIYSYVYQAATRGISVGSSFAAYTNARIDYGRDDAIKLTIFAELNPEVVQILEHRGQSLLFYLTAWIPREVWPEKPLPYAQYFTSALFQQPPREWGWSMTTSCLEEAIANFGWLGMLLGPMVPLFVCRISDQTQNGFIRLIGLPIVLLFLSVQCIAFAPLLIIWGGGLGMIATRKFYRAFVHRERNAWSHRTWDGKQSVMHKTRAETAPARQ